MANWSARCFDENNPTNFAGGDSFRIYRWTFARDHFDPGIRLDGRLGEFLSFTMRDDLTLATRTLVQHRFFCKGRVEATGLT